MIDMSGMEVLSNDVEDDSIDSQIKITLTALETGVAVRPNQTLVVKCRYQDLATIIGLTAEKIKSGETILGVTGTYTGEPAL